HPATAIDSRLNTIEYALREFFPHLRELRSSNPEFLKRCAKCALRGLCEQCPAKSWIEHGILDQPVQYCCEIAHEQARYLGVLKEGEMGWEVADWRARLKALKME
ncbi:MAG TPA: hypothetical protein PL181_15995, partial [bacterium]|nr:hypothetical protein [bacterium]